MNRSADWLRQAEADLDMSRNAAASGNFEWSCFAAQQAAEKGLNAVALARGLEAWGHSVAALLVQIEPEAEMNPDLIDAAKDLDHHYIPARYPNGLPAGAPTDLYSKRHAERAIAEAESVVEWCRSRTRRAATDREGGSRVR